MLSLTLESTIGVWHTPEDMATLVRHPWTYSVPNCSHCSSLSKLCTPTIQSRSSCHLRSSYRTRLAVPSVKLSIGSRSFSVSGPTVWNAVPDYLRNSTLSIDVFWCFRTLFKNIFICSVLTWRYSALETLYLCAIYIDWLILIDWLID